MRRSGQLDRSVGRAAHDHVCWVHDGGDDWVDVVTPYLHEGAEAGEALFYIADKDPSSLCDDLADLPGRDAMLASGQLRVAPTREAYGPIESYRIDRQISTYRAAGQQAVRDGYRGLRLAAEVSTMVATPAGTRTFARYELLLDEMLTCSPLVVLCGYDRHRLDTASTATLCFVHPLRHPAAPSGHDGMYAGSGGWHLSGELDLRTLDPLEVALSALPTSGDVHLRLDELRYCDAASIRALILQADRMQPTGRLVVHNPPELFVRALEVGWPGEIPGLEVRRR